MLLMVTVTGCMLRFLITFDFLAVDNYC